jgi:N-acetylmuramoyl-L-alanine amidase/putative methionine-R-sulfoxide reductase with GAF domain
MSASPNNAGLELRIADKRSSGSSRSATPSSGSGHQALQALLAFSALHEQIRERRALEKRNGRRLNREDSWELEQFVLDEALQLVAERAQAITGADGVAIAMAEGDAIICRASVGVIVPDPGVHLDPDSGFSGTCFRTGEVVRCDDADTDPRVDIQASHRLGAKSMVAVPLLGQLSVIGLMEAFSTEAYAFNDTDVRSLKLLAELILAAIKPEEEDRMAEISQKVVQTPLQAELSSPQTDSEIVPLPQAPTSPSVESDLEKTAIAAIPEIRIAEPAPAIFSTPEERHRITPGLLIVVLLVLLAMAVGAFVWWRTGHHQEAAIAPNRLSSLPASSASGTLQSAPADSATAEEGQVAINGTAGTLAKQDVAARSVTGQPLVTGIRHWSSATVSTVVIDIQDEVQYEAHRLTDPDRIYFDLNDTSLAPALFGQTINVSDAFLRRIRVAQPTKGVTRVVLETKGASSYSVSFEEHPYRLVVEVGGPAAKLEPGTKSDLFNPLSGAQQAPAAETAKNSTLAHSQTAPLRIALDAGHGGWDLGTVGRNGLMEKNLVLDIVDRLGKLVEDHLGAQVIYTRHDDTYVSLERRAEIANLSKADLFLSVHANYSDSSSIRGIETYYTRTYSSIHARTADGDPALGGLNNVDWTNVDIKQKVQGSMELAMDVQRSLFAGLEAKNPGLPNRGVKEASYVVLTGTTMPAVLAEVSFVSSPTDEKRLEREAYRQAIAEALYKGIARYAAEYHTGPANRVLAKAGH